MWGHGYGHPMMWGGGYELANLAFSILWVVVLVAAIVALVRYLRGTPTHSRHGAQPTPLDIIKERYAKGEIDKEQFEKMKKDLSA